MTPEERVRSFMAAMVEWEPRVHQALITGAKAEWQSLIGELRTLYDQHLSAKGKGANRFGRNLVSGPAVSNPPKFDQGIERVENGAKKSLFYVITKPRKDPFTVWRFTVTVDASGTPWIDDLHGKAVSHDGPKGEWSRFGY